MYFVYLIECVDGSIYTGIATDVKRRFEEHKKGIGARYTRAHRVKRIVHSEQHPSRSAALKREAQIKRFSREQKLSLFH
jgi:putative endonuclease